MAPYNYRPLPAGPNSIRLLQILPGEEGTDIVCQIINHIIGHDRAVGPYEALSYVWGDANDRHRIYVTDSGHTNSREPFHQEINRNLYAALQRLRDPGHPRMIWIDAICINQNDLEERASQVAIMSHIYSHAKQVLAWLGEEEDGSTVALNLIREAADNHQRLAYIDLAICVPTEIQKAQIILLLRRIWFERIWILQEIAAARFFVFLCGGVELTGASFFRGLNTPEIRSIWENDPHLPSLLDAVEKLIDWTVLRRLSPPLPASTSVPSLEIAPLADLIETFRSWKSSDQRDKIYALLGLSSDNAVSKLCPDYTKSWKKLFREVISWILAGSLSIETWEKEEKAVIVTYGSPIGIIDSIDAAQGRIVVEIQDSHLFPDHLRTTLDVPSNWLKRIRTGDIMMLLENRQHPSIVRFCHDHFDVIIISLSASRLRFYVLDGRSSCLKTDSKLWDCNMKNMSRSSRKIVLVWDWSAVDERHVEKHKRLLQAWTGGLSTHDTHAFSLRQPIERISTAARILDDVCDKASLLRIVQNLPLLLQPCSPAEKHIALLRDICRSWSSYTMMKHYLEDLGWCLWTLRREQHRTRYPDQIEVPSMSWLREGFAHYDVLDMLSLAQEGVAARKLQKKDHPHISQPRPHHGFYDDDCRDYQFFFEKDYRRLDGKLISVIFADSMQAPDNDTSVAKEPTTLGASGLWKAHFLASLLLTRDDEELERTEELVMKIFTKSIQGDGVKMLMLLCESNHTALPRVIKTISRLKADTLCEEKLTYLLAAAADDPWAVYNVLKEGFRRWLWRQRTYGLTNNYEDTFLMSNLSVIEACVMQTDFCKVLVEREGQDGANCQHSSHLTFSIFTEFSVFSYLTSSYEPDPKSLDPGEDLESFVKRWILASVQDYYSAFAFLAEPIPAMVRGGN